MKNTDKVLKRVFYQGLKTIIKQLAYNKCDTIEDYDNFKIEVRKIEADLQVSKEETKKCNAAVNVEKDNSELTQVKQLLQKMNNRIEKLEREKEERTQAQPLREHFYTGNRGYRSRPNYRGNSMSRGRGDSTRGRGGYQQYGQNFNTTQRTCYNCGVEGHIARNCPN